MIFDYTRTQKQADATARLSERQSCWKYYGIAYDRKFKSFVSWRTNSKTHFRKLKTRTGIFYADLVKVKVYSKSV